MGRGTEKITRRARAGGLSGLLTLAMVAVGLFGASLVFGQVAAPPAVNTDPVCQGSTVNSMDVNGTIQQNATQVFYYHYDYGTDPTLRTSTSSPSQPFTGDPAKPSPAPATITGLLPATHYYYRLVGEDRSHNPSYPATSTGECDTQPQIKPGKPTISINDVQIAEGDSGLHNVTFTVFLSAKASADVGFHAATADGTAQAKVGTPNGDYQAISIRGTIPAGQTSTQVTVPIRGDTEVEKNETFFVDLSSLTTNVDPGKLRGVGTIIDDDGAGPGPGLFRFTLAWGKEGLGAGQFGTGREVHGGDRQYDDPGGVLLVGGAGGARASAAQTVVAVDPSNNRIERFTTSGRFMGMFGREGFDPGAIKTVGAKGRYQLPQGVAADSRGNLYISDSRNDRVVKVSKTGKFLKRFGRRGAGPGRFVVPYGLTVVGTTLYVVDRANTRVQRWSLSGRYKGALGRFGAGPGKFLYPNDIQYYKGELYVTDSMKNQVLVFSTSGRYKRSFGSTGRHAGQMVLASGIAFSRSGQVLVGDRCNARVQAFTTRGAFVGSIGVGSLKTPTFLDTDSAGNLFVSDYHRIVKFAPAPSAFRVRAAGPTASAAHHVDGGPRFDVICRDEPRSQKHYAFGGMKLRGSTSRLDFGGSAYVRSYCSGRTYWYCAGTVTIKYHGKTIGKAPITVGSNDAPTVDVKLTGAARSLVRSRHRVRATVIYSVHDNQVRTRFRTTSYTTTLVS